MESKGGVVKKDIWNMLLELIDHTQGDFGKYEDDGAWPMVFNEFNDFYKAKHN